MSLVNILMTRDRAFVATDTLAMQADFTHVAGRVMGGAVKMPKILALPHARCVVAYRANDMEVLDSVRHALAHDFESTDAGMAELPQLLHYCVSEAAKRQGYASPEEADEDNSMWSVQLYMVGWSESEKCMALLFTWYEGTKQRTVRAFGSDYKVTHCLSCKPDGHVPYMPLNAQEMADLTVRLVTTARLDGAPGAKGVGGTLVISEIERSGVTLRHCGELGFPPYAKTGHLRDRRAPVSLQIATVPQVETGGIAPDAVAPIATAVQSGSTNVYLTEATIVSTSIDSQGYPIYVSFSVDANGSYSGDKATFRVKVNGTTSYTKEITATRDGSQVGNPWAVKGALVQTVIASPGTGTLSISVTAVGTHATYGVTVDNGNLYCEGKLR